MQLTTTSIVWSGHASAASWGDLSCTQSPLADLQWTRSFIDAFADADNPPVVHEVRRGSRLVACLPVVRGGGVTRTWTSLDNEHTPYWSMPGELEPATAERLLDALLQDAERVVLRRLPCESGACMALRTAAARMGLHVSLLENAGSGDARLRLRAPWDAVQAGLPKNLRADLPRKHRQLRKLGRLELETLTSPGPVLALALDTCFEIETRGWKGVEGSPIRSDPRTLRFYTELATSLAEVGRFALYVLRLDDRAIAFEYCLRGGGHLEMLKLSFDPAYERHSPGQVLRWLLLQQEVAHGEVTWYHLGRPSPWKLRWASDVAPLCTLAIYSTRLRARAAFLAGPVVRARLKASPAARAAYDLARQLRDRLGG